MGDRTRARSADRDRTIEIINAAYADGQLGEIVREHRAEAALHATTLAQLRALTQDLQLPTPPPPVTTRWERLREWGRNTSPGTRLVAVYAVLGIFVLAVLAVDSEDPAEDRAPEAFAPQPVQEPVVDDTSFAMTAEAMADMRDAYAEQFGTTETYKISFAPGYVLVDAPTQDGKERFEEWHWRDGTFEKFLDARTARGRPVVDLADVDFDRVEARMGRAERNLGIEEPEEVAVTIEHPSYEDVAVVRFVVSNEYGEMAYVSTDLSLRRVLSRQSFDDQ